MGKLKKAELPVIRKREGAKAEDTRQWFQIPIIRKFRFLRSMSKGGIIPIQEASNERG